MDVPMNLTFVKTAIDEFQLGRKDAHRNLLEPLPRPSHSREKELNDVYSKVQREIKKIKDDVLNDLAAGGAVDYDNIKSLFENAELEIQERKNEILLQFNTKAATVSTSNFANIDDITRRQAVSVSINADERQLGPNKGNACGGCKRSIKRNLSPTTMSISKKHFDIEKLRNIINPSRKDAQSLIKCEGVPKLVTKYAKTNKSQVKPITGSTICHQVDSAANSRLTSPPPSHDDARKGILNLIQRKMIPAASSLTIVPSPIKHQQVVLHEPSNKKLIKTEQPPSVYSLALVKFDKSTLDSVTDTLSSGQSADTSAIVSFHGDTLDGTCQELSAERFSTIGLNNPNMDHELSTLKALFPSSSVSVGHSSHKFIVQDGKSETKSQDFIYFKQYYCLTWESINKLLSKLEKLLADYSVPIAFINGDRLADMSLYFEIGPKPTMKDLLMCVLNSGDVEKIICIPGRRYLAEDGEDMAAIRIQALWRGYHQQKAYHEHRRKKWAAGLIALTWIMKCKLTYIKKHLKQKNVEYLLNYRTRMKVFMEKWRKIKSSKRLIIHIPSLGYPASLRRSVSDIASLQNCQVGRICDIKDPNVEVIYISPLNLDDELHEYYMRLIDIMCGVTGQEYRTVSERLKIFSPGNSDKFSHHNLCLSSSIKYCDSLIQRLSCLIKGKEAFIVPGFMHKDDLYVADKLDIPILGCEPDIAHLYSLKSGIHRIFESAGVIRAPGVHDVYTIQQFEESLSRLVTQNLQVTRWLFKIDNEFDGRGTAYCDITPHLECYAHAVKEAERYGEKWKELWAQENVYNSILKELPDIMEAYATPVDKNAFRNWQEFMLGFLGEGGIIEACPPADSVTGITGNVLIEPNGDIQILSVADQIHSISPFKCWGHTLPQSSFDVLILNDYIYSISKACKSRGIVGYISIDFVTFINPKTDIQELWAVGLKLSYSNCHAMIEMMKFLSGAELSIHKNKLEVIVHNKAKPQTAYQSRYKRTRQLKEKLSSRQQRFAVVSPSLIHTNMNNIAYSVFFQICKAHGIAYDSQMKIGTSFILINHSKREHLGMITIAGNLHDAVSTFALNLVAIHNDISTPNMMGNSNFQGAVDDLKSVLEALRINLEINQNKYPTMDPKDRRRIQSASILPSSDEDDINILQRTKSAMKGEEDSDVDSFFDVFVSK